MRCPLVPDIGIVSTLPTHPPASFAAGTTVRFTQGAVTTALGDVSPAAGWSLAWHVRGVGEADATVTDDGVRWTVSLPATATQALAAGGYTAALRASKDGDALNLDVRRITVTPDLANAMAGDLEDPDERALRLLIAARDGTLTQGFMTVMVDGKQLMHYSLDMLDRAIARYELKIAAKGRGSFGRVSVRFAR